MLLSDINNYFAIHKRACLADLATHFKADPDAITGMLDVLAARGRITRIASSGNCQGCTRCDPSSLIIYEWNGRTESKPPSP
ncbi:MAG TPA: sugar metabolism transcriptional regulator [Rhizobiales bacterium]|nr:sugar metabolism transcriptional regulator [Hyphomicrobiales bacterium]